MIGEKGIAPFIVEAVLNHKEIHSRLAGTYNKAKYTDEAGHAFQVLADWLEHILELKEAEDEKKLRNRAEEAAI